MRVVATAAAGATVGKRPVVERPTVSTVTRSSIRSSTSYDPARKRLSAIRSPGGSTSVR